MFVFVALPSVLHLSALVIIGNKSEQVLKEDSKERPQAKDLKDGELGAGVSV